MTITFLGSICAQTPVAFLVTHSTWRTCMLILSLIGPVIMVFMLILFNTSVYQQHTDSVNRKLNFDTSPLMRNIKQGISNYNNILCASYMCLIIYPIAWISELWGVTYFMHTIHVSNIKASILTSMPYFGLIVGSPIMGYLAELCSNKTKIMVASALSAFVTLIIIFNFTIAYSELKWVLFLLGIFTSAYTLGYSLSIEINHNQVNNISMNLLSTIIIVGVSSFLAIYALLQNHASWAISNITHYSFFNIAVTLPFMCVLSMLIGLIIKIPKYNNPC